MSLISKDIASIIAKYNTSTPIYVLTNWSGFRKYLAFEAVDEYTKYLFDNRFNGQLSWLRSWYNYDYDQRFHREFNNYEEFKQIFIRNLQQIDIDYYKK